MLAPGFEHNANPAHFGPPTDLPLDRTAAAYKPRCRAAQRIASLTALAVAWLFTSTSAFAVEEKHEGFYLRGQVGLAAVREQASAASDIRSYGGAGWVNVDVQLSH